MRLQAYTVHVYVQSTWMLIVFLCITDPYYTWNNPLMVSSLELPSLSLPSFWVPSFEGSIKENGILCYVSLKMLDGKLTDTVFDLFQRFSIGRSCGLVLDLDIAMDSNVITGVSSSGFIFFDWHSFWSVMKARTTNVITYTYSSGFILCDKFVNQFTSQRWIQVNKWINFVVIREVSGY